LPIRHLAARGGASGTTRDWPEETRSGANFQKFDDAFEETNRLRTRRLAAGEQVVSMMTEARGASNAKAKREFDWTPIYPA
jgi:hypothetical protein